MNGKENFVEVEDRKFIINKFPARVSLRIVKTVLSNILPNFSSFTTTNNNEENNSMEDSQIFVSIGNALKSLNDDELDKVIDTSLYYCFEELPTGRSRVLNENKTYGVIGVEEDLVLTLRLVTECLIFNYKDFLDESRWGSMLKGIPGISPLEART